MEALSEYTEEERLTFLKAVANLVGSDHKVSEDEEAELNALVLGAGLSPLDERVEKDVLGEMSSPGDIKEILANLDNQELREILFRVLVVIAAADGEITDSERAKVRDAAGVFGLDPQAASDYLDWTIRFIEHEAQEHEIMGRLGKAS